MNRHQYYLNTSSIYLMSTENTMPYVSKRDLPHFLVVGLKIEYINIDVISLEIAGGLRLVSIYNWEGADFSIFDYSCYDLPVMRVMLY